MGMVACPPQVIMLTFGASRCSRRFAGGITAGPTAAGVRSMARMPAASYFGAASRWTEALVASKTMSGFSDCASSQSTPSWVVSSPSLRARAKPSLSGSMPTIQRGSSHSERSSLYSRSVLMLPDPTIATLSFDGMDAPLLERQSDGPKAVEISDEVVAGAGVDGSGTRTGQHDVAGPKPHPKAFHLSGQPRHRGHRVSQHRVATTLGHLLAVRRQYRVDGLDIDVGRRDPRHAQHETRRRRVVGDGVAECDLPVGDPGVDQFDGRHERFGRGQHIVFGAVRTGQIVGQDEADFDFHPRVEVLVRLDG